MTSMFFDKTSQIPDTSESPQLKGSESREVETWCLSWCLINVPMMCSTCSLEVAGNLRDIRIATELREMWVKVCRRRRRVRISTSEKSSLVQENLFMGASSVPLFASKARTHDQPCRRSQLESFVDSSSCCQLSRSRLSRNSLGAEILWSR